MFCDRKLKALTGFCSKDLTRKPLLTVRFEGEKAVACNGEIAAWAEFPQSTDPTSIEPSESFNVGADTIVKAFNNLPKKKTKYQGIKGVRIAPQTAASYSDNVNCATFTDEVAQEFPDYKQVIPSKTAEDVVVSLSKKNLGILVDTMQTCEYESVTFRVPPMSGEGQVSSAVQFAMGNTFDISDQINGLVMPYRTPENLRNDEHILIIQEDVVGMLALLQELSPEDERVQNFAERYRKLIPESAPKMLEVA